MTLFCTGVATNSAKTRRLAISSVVIRPIFDQCEERHETLPSTKFYFRLILCTWLFYCLIITDTYRSELISYLMRPQIGISWLKKFSLLRPDQHFLRFGFRPGQTTSVNEFVQAEIESCRETEPKRAQFLEQILQGISQTSKLMKEKKLDVLKTFSVGGFIAFGDSFLLLSCIRVFERIVGGRFYEVSTDSVENRLYWAVSPGPWHTGVIGTMRRLRDGGILNYFAAQQDVVDYSLVGDDLIRNFFSKKEGDETKRDQRDIMQELAASGVQVLKVKHIYALLLLLVMGWVVSFGAFCKEFFFQRKDDFTQFSLHAQLETQY